MAFRRQKLTELVEDTFEGIPLDPPADLPDLLSPNFLGRDDELTKISEAFTREYGQKPARCAVYGMHGLGKTQLALSYGSRARDKLGFPYVFWISASSADAFKQGYASIAERLCRLQNLVSSQVAKIRWARFWLDNVVKSKWLLIIDDVDRGTVDTLQRILPQRGSQGNILFTTRMKDVAQNVASSGGVRHSTIALDLSAGDDAMEVFLRGSQEHIEEWNTTQEAYKTKERTRIDRVLAFVNRLPFAIVCASSFIRRTHCSIDDLLDVLRKNEGAELLEWETEVSQHEERSISALFLPMYVELAERSPDAALVLNVIPPLDPANIPVAILKGGATSLCTSRYKKKEDSAPSAPPANSKEAFLRTRTLLDSKMTGFVPSVKDSDSNWESDSDTLSDLSDQEQSASQDLPTVEDPQPLQVVQLFRSQPRMRRALQELADFSLIKL